MIKKTAIKLSFFMAKDKRLKAKDERQKAKG